MALSLQSGLSLGLIHNGGQFTIQGSHKDLCASPLEYHGTEAKGTMLQCLFTSSVRQPWLIYTGDLKRSFIS